MISRFDGICRYCHHSTLAGIDHYDLDSRTAFHQKCKDEDDAKPDPRHIEMADRLGYKTTAEWDVLLLPPEAGGDVEWWQRGMTGDRPSDTRSINDVRGGQDYL